MNKEEVYDTILYELVDRVTKICIANNIAAVIHFKIPVDDDPTLSCTTVLGDENGVPDQISAIASFIFDGSTPVKFKEFQDHNGIVIRVDEKYQP